MGESECLNNDQGPPGAMLNWGQDCSSAIRALAAAAPILKTLDRPGKAMAQQKSFLPDQTGCPGSQRRS